jgi:hypothetical protein
MRPVTERTRVGRRMSVGVAAGALALGTLAVTAAGTPASAGGTTPGGEPPTTSAVARLNPVAALNASSFANPANTEKPWVRWNFVPTDPTTTDASLQADLEDAAAHNIGGVEIGQGGVPTTDQLKVIYKKADELGITVSLKVASALPGQTYSSTDDYARRTLNFTQFTPVTSGATLDADVPGTASGTIVAVVAYQCAVAGCTATNGQVSLVRSSAIDLTSTLTGTNTAGYNGGSTAGHLTFAAPSTPAGASWLVTAYRAVPFGTTPETLSTQGTKEVTNAYDTYLGGNLGTLVKQNGGDFFVDSHPSDPWGVPQELWSSNMRSEFQARTGYDIVPDLAALADTTMVAGLGTTYTFSDGSANRIRSDFSKVRSDLYTANRITAFQAWAHTYNMKLRLQQEDIPITAGGDQIQTSIALDRSEHESLIGSDQTDTYRSMASGNHMTGNTWFSTECCAVLNESFAQTEEDYLVRMNREFAGGVTRMVYHTRPSTATSTSTWPGPVFNGSPGKVSFSNSYNSQQPYYTDAAATNDYFARTTEVLTQGAAKMDVAVYMRSYSDPAAFGTSDPSNKHWQDSGLQRAGYTWDYYDENSMDLPNATVSNRQLAAHGPDYKAIIFDQFLQPTTATTRGTLTVKAAQKMLEYAKAGLPVIFVGNPQSSGTFPASTDTDLNAVLSQLRGQNSFYSVPTEAAVPNELKSLGITPAAQTAAASSVLSVRRDDAATGTNYYWLYNQGVDAAAASTSTYGQNPSNLYEAPQVCHTADSILNPCMATGDTVDTTITLAGQGVPILLDTTSGRITPISEYSRDGDRVTVKLHLHRDDATVIALTTNPARFGVTASSQHASDTTADGAATSGGHVFVKAPSNGSYVTKLAGSTTPIVSTVRDVPAKLDLTHQVWNLAAEDWQPAAVYGTTGVAGSETKKVPVSVRLDSLKPWSQIPALQYASGVGTYTTTIKLPSDWKPGSEGATLSLGQVTDSFRVSVNGTNVPVDQVSGKTDISPALHAGANTLTVRVATTLNNRLYSLDTAVANRGLLQDYGLVGPVTVTPYRLVAVNPAKPGTKALKNAAKPKLRGTAKVGSTLRAKHGSWTPAATSFVYQWARNGKVFKTTTTAHYRLRARDRGKKIAVTVIASRSGYASAAATAKAKKIRK